MTFEEALPLVQLMISRGIAREDAITNPAIPEEFRSTIRETLAREDTITLVPARVVVAEKGREDWLRHFDRSKWFYWPALRDFLVSQKGWPMAEVRSLDEVTNRILGQLADPSIDQFDIRGLVLGYVQSGKTANFTAVAAKAADVGYRLIVVLSGIDNGLRRQTQIRLKRELVGYADNQAGSVRLPPLGRQWHEFTREELGGDFRPGFANHAALQGSQPVLLVVKKNGPVLRRLLKWLDEAPEEVRRTIPMLVIDDESDQASVDTRGSYQAEGEPLPDDYEEPSKINGLIRDLLRRFQRRAYVAYTATPFANILIPHDTIDPRVENDLYPKDFIVDLPKPSAYFGSEELFGRFDPAETANSGLDVVRDVPDEDVHALETGVLPASLETALIDFVLAGAARAQRGQGGEPATMLLHASRLVAEQARLAALVDQRFGELRDDWRYQRQQGIRDMLRQRWENEFRPVTQSTHAERDVNFERIEEHVGPFFESVQVRVVNSFTGDVLDYDREQGLKAIAVGGNRLSRGLTLEGLLVSYFIRRSVMYDTLMQMGRWFGFRSGYEDLTRIYTTPELAEWFSELAFVEHRLREDLRIYEDQGLTPYQVGMRIWQHPTMQVTSPLKRRFASSTTLSQSYSLSIQQTFKFPLRWADDLAAQAEENLLATRAFLSQLGKPAKADELARPEWAKAGPVWRDIKVEAVLAYLRSYRIDPRAASISIPLVTAYIERLQEQGELLNWTVAVRGRESLDRKLGVADFALPGARIHQITRSRIKETDSLGVITSPGDEAVGLSPEEFAKATQIEQEGTEGINPAARRARPPEEGLLLIYPISRHSGYDLDGTGLRRPIYSDSNDPAARDLIGLAISFPEPRHPQQVEAYLEGTAGWRPTE